MSRTGDGVKTQAALIFAPVMCHAAGNLSVKNLIPIQHFKGERKDYNLGFPCQVLEESSVS